MLVAAQKYNFEPQSAQYTKPEKNTFSARCDYEEDYTYEEYLKDMERDNLYNEAEKRIKKE